MESSGLQVYKKILEVSPEYGTKLRKNEQGSFTLQDIEKIKQQVSDAFFNDWQSKLILNGQPVAKEAYLGITLKVKLTWGFR